MKTLITLLSVLLLWSCAQHGSTPAKAKIEPLPPSAQQPFDLLDERYLGQRLTHLMLQQQLHLNSGFISSRHADQQLYFEHHPVAEPVASILLVHGFSESLVKFTELIHYFNQQGYEVFALEHRGHARSGRLGRDDYQVHVESWAYYVDDLQDFTNQIVVPRAQGPLLLYAHSMGGAIASAMMVREPELFQAAVLTAPMLQINTGRFGGYGAGTVASLLKAVGQGDRYLMGQGPYQFEHFNEQVGTHSQVRYDWYQQQLSAQPQLRHGGGSYGWLQQGLLLTRYLRLEADLQQIQTPVRLYQAELDDLVLPAGQVRLIERLPNASWILLSGAKHDLYRETNAWLGSYLADVFDFYAQHLP